MTPGTLLVAQAVLGLASLAGGVIIFFLAEWTAPPAPGVSGAADAPPGRRG